MLVGETPTVAVSYNADARCWEKPLGFFASQGISTADGGNPANHLGCIKPCK